MTRRIGHETDHRQSLLVERLRRAGLRATRPRLIILDVLERASGHRSIDELMDLLRARGVRLPRATVYNVIRSLVVNGLVMVADTGPGRMLVEPAQSWHHHFVCRQCGAVLDVACVVGAKPCLQPDLPGAEVDEAQVIWRGRCPRCVEKSRLEGGQHDPGADRGARPSGDRTNRGHSDRSDRP
ncbi:Fur family transcriptional regulator [Thermomicrobium sp.]